MSPRLFTYLLALVVAAGAAAQENVSGTTVLREMTVQTDRISEQGDTISYSVKVFAQEKDSSIGDVLERMPGISVDGSGKIQYQGEDINKFYIEGIDMLEGKYAVATNGISYGDVSAVEILENHQPTQVLSGISYSENAAINLKLKDSAKASWSAYADIGTGYSCQPDGMIWDSDAFAMTAKPRFQSMISFLTDNNGDRLTSQLTDLFATRRGTDLSRYVGVSLPDVPSLGDSRTMFNRSALLSTNALWKLGQGELKVQVDYSFSRIAAEASNVTTYFLDKGDLVISEDRNGVDRSHTLAAKLIYEQNQKSTFINNTLKTSIEWDDVSLDVTGSLPNSQTASLPDYYVGNDFKFIKRFDGKHLVTFTSNNEWESLPQTLSVTKINGFMRQMVKDHAFYTNESAAYAYTVDGATIGLEGGLKGYFRSLDTECSGLPIAIPGVTIPGVTENVLNTNYFMAYVTPKIEYWVQRINFTLNAPVGYAHFTFDKALANRSEVYFAPTLKINWKPDNRFSMDLQGGTGRSPLDLSLILPGYVMTSYRSFQRGVDDIYNSTSQNVAANFAYKHIRYGLFANVGVVQTWTHNPYTLAQNLFGNYVVYSYTSAKSDEKMLMAVGRVGKALDFMRGSANINGTFSRQESHLLSEQESVNSVGTTWSVGLKINGSPLSWFSFDYSFDYSASRLAMDDTNASWLSSVVNEVVLKFVPHKKWKGRLTGDFYRNELSADYYKNVYLVDAKVIYKINKHMSVSAAIYNIFNNRTYNYTSYSQLSQCESMRRLRGREFLISLSLSK